MKTKRDFTVLICIKKIAVLVLCLMLLMNAFPLSAAAQTEKTEKVVRVGWHEPPFYITDEAGRLSGYSYEYQRKIAAYTGWKYEYVKGSWAELMQMLKEGKIDLMSNVSYSVERTKDMLFSSLPMGTESYYVYVSPDNKEVTSENISSLSGKKIGVTKGSIQKDYFLDWAKKYNIEPQMIELTGTDEESMKLLGKQFDAFVTLDVYGTPETAVPVCKIGSSDFFFAISKNRSDLLPEIDAALNRIQDENKYYDQQLHDKYLKNSETNKFLTVEEREWLSKHGKIKVGYQDNYLAFCAKDDETGELTGALKDYLEYASKGFGNSEIEFEPVCFPTAAAALEALQKGEIDCMFPTNLTDHDAEKLGLLISPRLMHTEMDAVVRESEQKEFLRQEKIIVAVNEGNTNYDVFLADHYPKWNREYFKDTPAALDAVADKKADCVIISSYRYNNISKQCEKLHLTTVYTGVDMDYCIAVREGETTLYSIMTRITDIVPDATVHTSLTYYSTEDVKTSFMDFIKDNLFIVIAVIVSILLIIFILLLVSVKAEKKARKEKHLVKALNRRVFVDSMTSVRNKGAYTEYIGKLNEGLEAEELTKLSIGIFDCDDLKYINDNYGHDKGDIYLKTACQLICKVFDHSPVFRVGGDEFAVILQNNDLKNKDELIELFEKRRQEICQNAKNKWEEVHIAFGIADYDPQQDSSVSDTVQRADKIMYENKRVQKAGRSVR